MEREAEMSDFLWNAAGVVVGIATMISGVVLIIAAIVWLIISLSFPGDLAAIESVRHDAQEVSGIEAQGVYALAAKWNASIRTNQAMNHQWWSGWVIPDEWDAIDPIAINGTAP